MGMSASPSARWFAVILTAGLLLASCATDEVTEDQPVAEPDSLDAGAEEELEEAAETWTKAGITDYELDVLFTCFCPVELAGPFQVTVRAGEVVTVEFVNAADAANADAPAPLIEEPSVEGLFESLIEAVQSDRAEVETAVYDAELGYPTDVFIDPQPNAVDDEFGWEVRDLRPLP